MTAKFIKRRGTIAVVEAKAEVDGKLSDVRDTYFCYWQLIGYSNRGEMHPHV